MNRLQLEKFNLPQRIRINKKRNGLCLGYVAAVLAKKDIKRASSQIKCDIIIEEWTKKVSPSNLRGFFPLGF